MGDAKLALVVALGLPDKALIGLAAGLLRRSSLAAAQPLRARSARPFALGALLALWPDGGGCGRRMRTCVR